jgi:release factor glutamine methyltransferase
MTLTIAGALSAAQQKIDDGDARALLRHVVARDAAFLIGHSDDAMSGADQRAFEALVERRAGGEPVAYLTGEREFFSLKFRVTPAVLIPRPETELLVELALARVPQDAPCRVLDLGTGSGCIAVSIAKHRPNAQVTATDRSQDALDIAAANAQAHHVQNLSFALGHWFGALGSERFDLIVSNPPYIAEGDPHLGAGDLPFEPRQALIGGLDGLDCIREIVATASDYLIPGGWLMFEHGYNQAERCRAVLKAAGFQQVFSRRDLNSVERVSGGQTEGLTRKPLSG